MPSASRPTFLRHFGRAVPYVPDLADMGTAFALDQSMDQVDYSATLPGESPTAPSHGVVPVAPWRLWLGRKLGA